MKKLLRKKVQCTDAWKSDCKIVYDKEIVVEHSISSDIYGISMYVANGNDDDDIFITLDKHQAAKLVSVLMKIILKRMP